MLAGKMQLGNSKLATKSVPVKAPRTRVVSRIAAPESPVAGAWAGFFFSNGAVQNPGARPGKDKHSTRSREHIKLKGGRGYGRGKRVTCAAPKFSTRHNFSRLHFPRARVQLPRPPVCSFSRMARLKRWIPRWPASSPTRRHAR
jgi:hypothetical protein